MPRKPSMLLLWLPLCLATALTDAPVAAQVIQCVTPAEPKLPGNPCTFRAPTYLSDQVLVVRVVGAEPISNRPVTFTLESPGGSVTTVDTTNENGEAQFTWKGAAGGETTITASTTVAGRTIHRLIEVKPAQLATERALLLISDPVVYGYEKRQIDGPVTVRIANAEDCGDNVVVFRPYGTVGTGSPDSVWATPDPLYGGCTASSYWRLGEGVGRQHLRASLADEPSKSLTLNAIARALPRLSAGLASTYDFRSYRSASISKTNVQITRRTDDSNGEDSLIVVDSIVKSVSLDRHDAGWSVRPVLSIDFPISARLTHLRASLGAALQDADQDWYVGFSAIQVFRGVSQEAVGADIHTVLHFGRRNVLSNPSCEDDGILDDCEAEREFFFPLGIGFMATFDAAPLFGLIGSLIQ